MFLSDRDIEGHKGVSLSLLWKCMHVLCECVNMLCPSLSANVTLISSFYVQTTLLHSMFASRLFYPFAFPPSVPSHTRCVPSAWMQMPSQALQVTLPQSFNRNFYIIVYSGRVKTILPSSWHYTCQKIMCGKLRAIVRHRQLSQAYTLQKCISLTDNLNRTLTVHQSRYMADTFPRCHRVPAVYI